MSKVESIPKMWSSSKDLKSVNILPSRVGKHNKKACDKRPVEEIDLDDIESPSSKERKRASSSNDSKTFYLKLLDVPDLRRRNMTEEFLPNSWKLKTFIGSSLKEEILRSDIYSPKIGEHCVECLFFGNSFFFLHIQFGWREVVYVSLPVCLPLIKEEDKQAD
jgi:hypothetical protein